MTIRPWVAALTLTLRGVLLSLIWSRRDLWAECAAWIPVLSTTGFASVVSLGMSLALVLCTTRLRWRDLGLTPRQIRSALSIASLVWLATQAAQILDARWFGEVAPAAVDLPGAILSAYSEEFLFRLVAISGATRVAATRMNARSALRMGFVVSVVLFAVSHIPHDLVEGNIYHLERYPQLLAYGGLMALVWLTTGNLMTATLIHMLDNQPPLVIAGAHSVAITIVVNWIACGAVILAAAWRRSRAAGRMTV